MERGYCLSFNNANAHNPLVRTNPCFTVIQMFWWLYSHLHYGQRNVWITVKRGLVRTKGSWLIYLATQDSINANAVSDVREMMQYSDTCGPWYFVVVVTTPCFSTFYAIPIFLQFWGNFFTYILQVKIKMKTSESQTQDWNQNRSLK